MIALLLTLALQPVDRLVIVVGHNASPDRPALRFADDDAARTFELLAPGAAWATLLTTLDAPSQEVFAHLVAVAHPPTQGEVAAAFAEAGRRAEAARAAGRRAEVTFVYAGHGDVQDGEGRVHLADGPLTRSALKAHVGALPAAHRVHLVIDACRSWFLVAGRGPGGQRAPVPAPFAGPAWGERVGLLVSTSGDADSHEWAAIQGGIFSHEVRSALAGGADVDGDGAVRYDEVAAFVANANLGVEAVTYRPEVYIRPPAAELNAALFAPAAPRVRLDLPREAARWSISEKGLRYADLHKGEGPLAIWLLPQRRYEVRQGAQSWTVQSDTSPIALAALSADPPEVAAATRGEAHRAFEQLFQNPFDPGVLRGFRLGRDLVAEAPPPVEAEASVLPRVLLAGGIATTAGGVVLGLLAADARLEAADAPQASRAELNERGTALGYGAAAALVVGVGALAVALWEVW